MEKLMRKCLDSILAQTFTDFECLLIDDGSTDGSPTICDEYAQKDARIKVYHKPNGGLSDARNYGLERAQGKYSIFADPDDWVDAKGLDQFYEKAVETDADMVMCDIYYNDPYRQSYSSQKPSALDHYSVLKDILSDKVQGFTVIKLIKTELYTRFNLKYPIGIYGCEDQYTICKLLKNNIHIEYVPIAFYHYMFYSNNTLSRKYDDKTLNMDLKIRNMFTDLVANTELEKIIYQRKSATIVFRAFMYGKDFFSSKSFKETFSHYKEAAVKEADSFVLKILLMISFKGYYPFARNIFTILFNTKQIIKKLIFLLHHNK